MLYIICCVQGSWEFGRPYIYHVPHAQPEEGAGAEAGECVGARTEDEAASRLCQKCAIFSEILSNKVMAVLPEFWSAKSAKSAIFASCVALGILPFFQNGTLFDQFESPPADHFFSLNSGTFGTFSRLENGTWDSTKCLETPCHLLFTMQIRIETAVEPHYYYNYLFKYI